MLQVVTCVAILLVKCVGVNRVAILETSVANCYVIPLQALLEPLLFGLGTPQSCLGVRHIFDIVENNYCTYFCFILHLRVITLRHWQE
jgi:hypothetical protein